MPSAVLMSRANARPLETGATSRQRLVAGSQSSVRALGSNETGPAVTTSPPVTIARPSGRAAASATIRGTASVPAYSKTPLRAS